MKKLILSFSFIFYSLFLFSQQDPMYTHYMDNTLSINPAYAGSRDALTFLALNRSQWIGFEGAPITQTFTMHGPVFSPNTGLGLSIVNDKIGPTNTTALYVDFAYRIKFPHSYLAFGLKSGINFMKVGLQNVSTNNPDPAFSSNINSDLMPNFGMGIYYYTDKYYIGFSVPKILENNLFTGTTVQSNLIDVVRHYFFIAGTYFNLSDNIKLKPTTFVKYVPNAPVEVDITASAIYHDKLLAGIMYRTGDAVGILAGYFITPQLYAGYSFDWSMANTTGRYNAGSHEILLRYDFFMITKKRIRSPRYF